MVVDALCCGTSGLDSEWRYLEHETVVADSYRLGMTIMWQWHAIGGTTTAENLKLRDIQCNLLRFGKHTVYQKHINYGI